MGILGISNLWLFFFLISSWILQATAQQHTAYTVYFTVKYTFLSTNVQSGGLL